MQYPNIEKRWSFQFNGWECAELERVNRQNKEDDVKERKICTFLNTL